MNEACVELAVRVYDDEDFPADFGTPLSIPIQKASDCLMTAIFLLLIRFIP